MEKLEAPITCENCGTTFKVQLENMRPGLSATCPKCQTVYQFKGDDASTIQRELDNLKTEFK